MSSKQILSGWGRYPRLDCEVVRPSTLGEMAATLPAAPAITRGNGRSYGDSSLAPALTMQTGRLDRMIAFDADRGILTCEGGVLLSDIIDVFLPRGWFAPVTPGTKFVSVGGMIASDVHGKNHHIAGSFCDHVLELTLALGNGETIICSKTAHADLFAATCGGMGLTGVILSARFQLLKVESAWIRQRTIRARSLAEAFAAFEDNLDWTYSVGWIDCLASGKSLGKSAIFLGEHALPAELPAARASSPFARPSRRSKSVPLDFPAFALNRLSVRLFNQAYYRAQKPGDAIVGIDPYFYPLDAILEWNRIYGRPGFVQYQCVLPLEASEAGLTQLLTEIAAHGNASFLAVLKRMGPESFGHLSFPSPGYTLALDFPVSAKTFALLDRLDAITANHGGRLYLAKDARMAPSMLASGYPRLERLQQVRQEYGLADRFASVQSQRLEIA